MVTEFGIIKFLLSVGRDSYIPHSVKEDLFLRIDSHLSSGGQVNDPYILNNVRYYFAVRNHYLSKESEEVRKLDSKERSQMQEATVAQEINGRVVVASGALWGSKGDVRNDNFLVECKTTLSDSYRLKFTVWNKIRKEATRDGIRIPVMCVDLLGGLNRFAIFESGVIPIPCEEVPPVKKIYTSSFVVRGPCTISFEKYRLTSLPIHLSCIPWEDFLKYTEDWV